jgi:hypothetical protein
LFDEECRQLLEQKSKAYQTYLDRLMRANRAECEEESKWVIVACRKEKRWVINQQFLAGEEKFNERNPRQACRMVQKIKYGYKPHTNQCKDTEENIIGDKEQIEGRWKERFKEMLNESKRNSKTTALDIEQYQMNTQSGEMGIQAPTEQETQLALQKLNSNKAVGIDGSTSRTQAKRRRTNK